jgi:ornithine decarboxylase
VTSGEGSDWPLSRKYGCSTGEAVAILRKAAELGLRAEGISFHVGSQQRDPEAWADPIAAAARVFAELRAVGMDPWLLDLGGGFPAPLDKSCPPPEAYGVAIERHLSAAFDGHRPTTIVEPGRGIAATAGVLVSSVVGVAHRGGTRWVFLDAGLFTGLVETLDEAIRYPLTTDVPGPTGPAVLCGPTCDSTDILYEKAMVELPLALAEGDQVRFHCAGAYTSTYSTVGFNGFAPLATVTYG